MHFFWHRLILRQMFFWNLLISSIGARLTCCLTATFSEYPRFLSSMPPYPRQYRTPVHSSMRSRRPSDVHVVDPATAPSILSLATLGGLPLLGRSSSPSKPSAL